MLPDSLLDRMVLAVENVRERLVRATAALEVAGVPYAVVGGNAVAAWVSSVDSSAIRNTPNVDILLRREDFDAAQAELANAGFSHRCVNAVDLFMDGCNCTDRNALRIVFAHVKMREDDLFANPDVTEFVDLDGCRILGINALVRAKLVAFRRIDKVHLDDLINIGLVDETWPAKYPPELASRLQMLLDNRE